MGLDFAFWKNKRVLITGHTGFKGAWLSCLLNHLGAKVFGMALAPQTQPSLFDILGLESQLTHYLGDIRDFGLVKKICQEVYPELIIHLAAQSLVRVSYQNPFDTFTTNINGTLNLLEALRCLNLKCTILVITSDKSYLNQETGQAFKETDALGGKDPYSASKAATELVSLAYLHSFFQTGPCQLATARAGNVIGGGDWAQDRLIPDIIQAFLNNQPVTLRNPQATRPWQHVLEPLSGYLLLLEKLVQEGSEYSGPWNFGPSPIQASASVASVTEALAPYFELNPQDAWQLESGFQPYEAQSLALDITKAQERLGWHPVLSLEETLKWVAKWYIAYENGQNMQALTQDQILRYLERFSA